MGLINGNDSNRQSYPHPKQWVETLRVPNLLGSRFINVGFLPKNGPITRDVVIPWDIKKLTVRYQFCSEFVVKSKKGNSATLKRNECIASLSGHNCSK